jgi:voltage-gated potassium channel
MPFVVLGFIWLLLTVLEFTKGLSPFMETLNTCIWGLFVAEFVLKLVLAPHKGLFLRNNLFLILSLALPALRVFRIARLARVLRVARVARGARLIRVLSAVNRGMRALAQTLGRRGFGYVAGITLLVTFAGAAGIYAFEKESGVLNDYGTSLWWTAMILTTMGSDYFPKTAEGKLLCLLLAIYGFAVFGYVTAMVASYFVEQDTEEKRLKPAEQALLNALRGEIESLREEIRRSRG